MPTKRSTSASIAGWLLVAFFAITHLYAVSGRIKFVSGLSLVAVMGGLVFIFGGWPRERAYWVPIVFLGFMIPLPMSTIAGLNLHLKLEASKAAAWLTYNVFGVPVVLDASYVFLPSDPVTGATKSLIVENVCGGLRSLIALTFFSALFAVVCRVKGWWCLFMLVMAVPMAIACNVARITTLNLTAHYNGVKAVGEGALIHNWPGILVSWYLLWRWRSFWHLKQPSLD